MYGNFENKYKNSFGNLEIFLKNLGKFIKYFEEHLKKTQRYLGKILEKFRITIEKTSGKWSKNFTQKVMETFWKIEVKNFENSFVNYRKVFWGTFKKNLRKFVKKFEEYQETSNVKKSSGNIWESL